MFSKRFTSLKRFDWMLLAVDLHWTISFRTISLERWCGSCYQLMVSYIMYFCQTGSLIKKSRWRQLQNNFGIRQMLILNGTNLRNVFHNPSILFRKLPLSSLIHRFHHKHIHQTTSFIISGKRKTLQFLKVFTNFAAGFASGVSIWIRKNISDAQRGVFVIISVILFFISFLTSDNVIFLM